MSLLAMAETKFGECLGESGDEARFRCPYHDDLEGKLYCNTVTGLWVCFGGSCGRKGKLAAGDEIDEITILRARIKSLRETITAPENEVLPEGWLRQFQHGHGYWTGVRGFTGKTVDRFNLGFDPQTNRLTIPIRNVAGELQGAILRAIDGSRPKYLHPKGFRTGHHLYGAHLIGERKKVALVEGPLDAVACWDARVPALACHGARVTEGQRWLLGYLGVEIIVPFFDNDLAGRRASAQVHDELGSDFLIYDSSWRREWGAKDPGELKPDQRRIFYHQAARRPHV